MAIAIVLLLVGWNTAGGAGEVTFHQPYEPSGWRVWESRNSALLDVRAIDRRCAL
jgi:hypothetical protein